MEVAERTELESADRLETTAHELWREALDHLGGLARQAAADISANIGWMGKPGFRLRLLRPGAASNEAVGPVDAVVAFWVLAASGIVLYIVLDTSALAPADLRAMIEAQFGGDNQGAITIGDRVMMYEPISPIVRVVESTPGIKGTIISSEDHNKIMGDLFIAFIDKGSDDKIVPGQMYIVYYQETVPTGVGKQTVTLNPVDIGAVLVLRVEKNTSTVVITDSTRKISPGQEIRTP